jgi:hypothetical protein
MYAIRESSTFGCLPIFISVIIAPKPSPNPWKRIDKHLQHERKIVKDLTFDPDPILV